MRKLLPSLRVASTTTKRSLSGRPLRTISIPALFWAAAAVCSSQPHPVVCSGGFGSFHAQSTTGVTLSVGPARNGEFAQRTCNADLSWGTQHQQIESGARQVDVDLMGADLGFGSPVAALQVKTSDDAEMMYEIYSLANPPKKLRTITGGDSFFAADTNLDGRIEIWAGDAHAIDGFEGLPAEAFDAAPSVVLRFDKMRLMDVSAEFQTQYDRQIASLRAQLAPRQLSAFKSSDGKVSGLGKLTVDEFHALIRTKVLVMEIVWAYLYSGREQEAWHVLADLWPTQDTERIRQAIVSAREHGIRTQIDGVSTETKPARAKRRVIVYDAAVTGLGKINPLAADTLPEAILITRPPAPEGQADAGKTEVEVNLIVDFAGKVWSATMDGKPDKSLLDSATHWRFTPALKAGRPVASRDSLMISPKQ